MLNNCNSNHLTLSGSENGVVPLEVFNNPALLYGDCLFTSTNTLGTKVLHWSKHKKRILNGAKEYGWELEKAFMGRLSSELRRHLSPFEGAKEKRRRLRITLWPKIKNVFSSSRPSDFHIFISSDPLDVEDSSHEVFTPIVRKTFWGGTQAKYNDYKEVLRSIRGNKNLVADNILFVDKAGNFLEAAFKNIFFIKNKSLFLPILQDRLEGVGETYLIQMARENGFEILYKNLCLENMLDHGKGYTINSVKGVTAIAKISDIEFPEARVEFIEKLRFAWESCFEEV